MFSVAQSAPPPWGPGSFRRRDREPPVAGPGMASRGRTRRLAPDHSLDSTICDYGLAKEGARHHGYTGPWLSPAAGHCRRHRRRADGPAARGPGQHRAGHFLRETVGRVRYAGARGQLTVRADSGFYTHAIVAVCRGWMASPSLRQHGLRNPEAIPETDCAHSLLDGRCCGRDHLQSLSQKLDRGQLRCCQRWHLIRMSLSDETSLLPE